MDTVKPITQGLIVDWELASKNFYELEEKIVERIDYIIRTIFKTFDESLTTWYFADAQEGQVGHLTYDNPEIFMTWDHRPLRDDMIIIKDDGEWSLDNSIPTDWLFKDFEQELIDGKKEYENRQTAKKEARKKISAAQTKADMALAKAAKQKLTKKELAALRRSL